MPADVDRKEAGAVRDRREPVDRPGKRQRPKRIERRIRQNDAAQGQQDEIRARHAEDDPDTELEHELTHGMSD